MFQLWKLVLLCGLLTGASASVLGAAEGVLQELKSNLNALQGNVVSQLVQDSQNLVNSLLSDEQKLLNIKITDLSILDIHVDLSSDGQGVILRFPVTANITVKLPVIGKVVNLQVSLDLLTTLKLGTDDLTGLPIKVVGECTADSSTISLSLLDRQSLLINKVLDGVTGLLGKTVSFLLQNLVCPLIQLLINGLSVDLLQNVLSTLLSSASGIPL